MDSFQAMGTFTIIIWAVPRVHCAFASLFRYQDHGRARTSRPPTIDGEEPSISGSRATLARNDWTIILVFRFDARQPTPRLNLLHPERDRSSAGCPCDRATLSRMVAFACGRPHCADSPVVHSPSNLHRLIGPGGRFTVGARHNLLDRKSNCMPWVAFVHPTSKAVCHH